MGCAAWYGRRRGAGNEEDARVRWGRALLHLLLRPHEDARKLHQGNLRCPQGDLRVPHAGPLEADAVRQDAVPGVLGPPAADEDEDGGLLSARLLLAPYSVRRCRQS